MMTGARVEIGFLFFAGGFVKFDALAPINGALANLAGPMSLLLFSTFIIGSDAAATSAWSTVTQLANSLVNLSLQQAVSDLYMMLSTETYPVALAVICAGVAALNLLPVPVLNGGGFLIQSFQILSGQEISEGAIKAWMSLGLLVVLFVFGLFLIAVIF